MPAIAYAARHPDRVTHLVLFGGSTRGATLMSPAETQALLTLIERDWELFVQAATHAWLGWSTTDATRPAADAFRQATTPTVARAAIEDARDIDVTSEAARVTAPTLVLHRQGERQLPIEVSEELAASIPNARLVQLPGSTAGLFYEDPDGDVRLLLEFLTGSAPVTGEGSIIRPERGVDRSPALTSREREVLALIAQGESNAEIARRLSRSIHTIERHVTSIYRKIDARGRADATAYAIRHGLA
jgi:DNA-binding CsgD family transcriptional regulator